MTLQDWITKHGGTDSLSAGWDFPIKDGQTVTVAKSFRANRYLKAGTKLRFAGFGAYVLLFRDDAGKWVRLSPSQVSFLRE